jgi:type I restriction enzyme S subunit
LPWISAASLKSFYVDESDRNLTAAGAELATNIVPARALLMVVRGMSLKTEFRFGVAQRSVAFGQDCKAILPSISASVLAIALRSLRNDVLELVDESAHGTGRLQTDRLEQLRIAVPNHPALPDALDRLLARGGAAARETRALTDLRDTLLPEVLSGRIRAREVAEAVG